MTKAILHLKSKDQVLAGIIERVGKLDTPTMSDYFYTLVDAIASQQLSGKASEVILGRLKALYADHPYPTPDDILGTPDDVLRGVGFSWPKVTYLKDLARNFKEKIINPNEFQTLSDEEIIEKLVIVKGIGCWTAEIFLMFSLNKPDVLPADDLGLQKAIQLNYGLAHLPRPKEVVAFGEIWRPYRTVASRYLWKSLDFRAIAQ